MCTQIEDILSDRYEDKLSYWSGRTKPSRWPKIIVTRLDKVNENIGTMEAGHRDHRDGLFSLKGYNKRGLDFMLSSAPSSITSTFFVCF